MSIPCQSTSKCSLQLTTELLHGSGRKQQTPAPLSRCPMQVPKSQRRQMMEAIQAELAQLVAAAVHQGWLSVQEGICDLLDCVDAPTLHGPSPMPVADREDQEWALWTVQQYLDPALPGVRLQQSEPCEVAWM